jgi:hypothetical protein
VRLSILLISIFATTLFAADQQQRSAKGWPCASKIDPSYIMIAEESGGQIQMFQPAEASGSLTFMESKLAGNEETVYRTSGEMTGELEATILIDPSIESVTFSAFVQCMKNISIFDPSGKELLSGASNSKDNKFISGRIVTLSRPASGRWKIRMEGTGYSSIIAEAKTQLTLAARFVELGGRPGHEGYFPIQRPPMLNAQENLSIELDGKIKEARLLILNREGQVLQKKDETTTEFLCPITLHEAKFRLQISGVDENGNQFERMDSHLFHASE